MGHDCFSADCHSVTAHLNIWTLSPTSNQCCHSVKTAIEQKIHLIAATDAFVSGIMIGSPVDVISIMPEFFCQKQNCCDANWESERYKTPAEDPGDICTQICFKVSPISCRLGIYRPQFVIGIWRIWRIWWWLNHLQSDGKNLDVPMKMWKVPAALRLFKRPLSGAFIEQPWKESYVVGADHLLARPIDEAVAPFVCVHQNVITELTIHPSNLSFSTSSTMWPLPLRNVHRHFCTASSSTARSTWLNSTHADAASPARPRTAPSGCGHSQRMILSLCWGPFQVTPPRGSISPATWMSWMCIGSRRRRQYRSAAIHHCRSMFSSGAGPVGICSQDRAIHLWRWTSSLWDQELLLSVRGNSEPIRFSKGEDVLPCALTLTAYIQFPLTFLLGLFCHPFGGQKPLSVIDHGIWFFIEPDRFSRNVIRNCMNVLNSRSWATLKTFMLHQFPRWPLARDTGLIWREENDRTWNRDHWILCIHMLNTVIKEKTAFCIEVCFEGRYRSSNF
jgi:hypothetical protein